MHAIHSTLLDVPIDVVWNAISDLHTVVLVTTNVKNQDLALHWHPGSTSRTVPALLTYTDPDQCVRYTNEVTSIDSDPMLRSLSIAYRTYVTDNVGCTGCTGRYTVSILPSYPEKTLLEWERRSGKVEGTSVEKYQKIGEEKMLLWKNYFSQKISQQISSSDKKKVIIDTDPGIDDAMALFLALASPEIEVLGVTIVHGNSGNIHVLGQNACKILEMANCSHIPVFLGAHKPLHRPQHNGVPYVHGEDAMGDIKYFPPKKIPESGDAVDFIIEQCSAYPGQITIITLGPLTNLALVLQKDKKFPEKVRNVVTLAGAINHPGNRTSVAEANVYDDPEAAHIFFNSELNIFLITLNITQRVVVNRAFMKDLAQNDIGIFLENISNVYFLFNQKISNRDRIFLHDPTAVLAAIVPEAFTEFSEIFVDVETKGEFTIGMTIADGRERVSQERKKNVKMYTKVEVERILLLFKQRILMYYKNK